MLLQIISIILYQSHISIVLYYFVDYFTSLQQIAIVMRNVIVNKCFIC